MAKLKREVIKYLRDFIKKDYKAKDYCYVCSSKDTLELHHLYGLSETFSEWCSAQGIDRETIVTLESVLSIREEFAKDKEEVLSNKYLYTLCKKHHIQLHSLFGQRYSNYTAKKVLRWLELQKDKK
jgi:hypothetical protein